MRMRNFGRINCINPLYFIIDKINGQIDKINGNKYLTLVSTDESKDTLKTIMDYEAKSDIFLDQQLLSKTILMKNMCK